MLRIQSFSKTYAGGKKAVDDLTLTVQPGEIVGFIGHNGAGKSTTLRACAGVLDFTEGTIAIDGHDVRREPVAAKRVTAFLPDNPDLYEFMTGVAFLNFVADLYDIPAKERTERIAKYADASNAADKALAIEHWLRNNCVYTLTPDYPDESRDFVSQFVLDGRDGYCSYFASAMTVMCRIAGLPARYVEGYSVSAAGADQILTGEDALYEFLYGDTEK